MGARSRSFVDEPNAYDLACKEAWAIVEGCVVGVLEQIEYATKHGESFEVSDIVHEVCDGALVYTRDHYICAWALRESDDYEDFGHPDSWEKALAQRAFCNLRGEVMGHSEVQAAITKAEEEAS